MSDALPDNTLRLSGVVLLIGGSADGLRRPDPGTELLRYPVCGQPFAVEVYRRQSIQVNNRMWAFYTPEDWSVVQLVDHVMTRYPA